MTKLKLLGVCLARDTLLSILSDLGSATRGEAPQICDQALNGAASFLFQQPPQYLTSRAFG